MMSVTPSSRASLDKHASNTHTVKEVSDPHIIHTAHAALLTSALKLSLYFGPPLLEFDRGNCLDPLPSTSFLSIAPRMEQRGGVRQKGEFLISGDSIDALILEHAIYLSVVFILTVTFNRVTFNKTEILLMTSCERH